MRAPCEEMQSIQHIGAMLWHHVVTWRQLPLLVVKHQQSIGRTFDRDAYEGWTPVNVCQSEILPYQVKLERLTVIRIYSAFTSSSSASSECCANSVTSFLTRSLNCAST